MADVTIQVPSAATAQLLVKNASGTIVPPLDVPQWSIDNTAVATLAPSPDGLSVVVTAVAAGTGNLTAVSSGLTATALVTVTAATDTNPASLEIVWQQ